jgi:hypothetical protein
VDGIYKISTDHVRTLALRCHAYDLQFDRLFNSQSICGPSKRTYDAYNRELSASLLNLAISIRVSLGSDPEYERRNSGIGNAGLFEDRAPHRDGTFSIKDVCDKLIHARSISKPLEQGAVGACCKLVGSYRGKAWELDLGVQIFSEYVLKWLDDIDARAAA